MSCELTECCQFFSDNMKDMPGSAEYIRNRLCFGDFAACNRYRIFKEFGDRNIPLDLGPDDIEQVNKVIRCLRKKQASEG